ncbi:MAG: hypothetical protein M9928_11440 [Anaerolineae bacterium]|nr:hypothetical protein [Anaerolineae bacterium]MCO5188163.1 hypothetical protein [Anaerolineae bacterium]MCO5193036.1 hypothetical protein [Anaerolineae bacterium]MCO5205638.1 hypothetical protein [Anaerolineae bacterium]
MNLADLFQSQLEDTPAQVTAPEGVPDSAETPLTQPADSLADKPVEIVLTLLPGAPFSTRRIKGAVSVDGNLPLFLTTDAVATAMLTVIEEAYGQLRQQAEAKNSAEPVLSAAAVPMLSPAAVRVQSDARANVANAVMATGNGVAIDERVEKAQGALSIF